MIFLWTTFVQMEFMLLRHTYSYLLKCFFFKDGAFELQKSISIQLVKIKSTMLFMLHFKCDHKKMRNVWLFIFLPDSYLRQHILCLQPCLSRDARFMLLVSMVLNSNIGAKSIIRTFQTCHPHTPSSWCGTEQRLEARWAEFSPCVKSLFIKSAHSILSSDGILFWFIATARCQPL